jgi:hypothetical protein
VTAVDGGGPVATVEIQVDGTTVSLDGRLMKGRSFESAVASLNFMHGGASTEATLSVRTKVI